MVRYKVIGETTGGCTTYRDITSEYSRPGPLQVICDGIHGFLAGGTLAGAAGCIWPLSDAILAEDAPTSSGSRCGNHAWFFQRNAVTIPLSVL